VRYFSGKEMPKNVYDALRLTGKAGFITRGIWRDFFALGNERWNREQVRLLCERKLLERHPNPIAEDCFVLSRVGRVLLAKHGLHFVGSPYVSQVAHDETIIRSLLSLSREGIAHQWHLESEMKCYQMRQHQLNNSARDQKYPDAVMNIRALGRDRLCAVEYERTRKAPQRYKDILWLYSRMESYWLVLFVCETDTISNTIKRQLHHLKEPSLLSRVAFTSAKHWTTAPESAPIELDDKTFSLKELCAADLPKAA